VRGSVTAWLRDGVYAGAFVQVEATDGTPSPSIYFAALEGRVVPMPRDDVSAEVLNEAGGRWRLYGRDTDDPVEDVWPYRLVTAAAAQDHAEASRIRPRRYVRQLGPDGVRTRAALRRSPGDE
jgi:hypothetical protein